jgi:hypothetical protein
VRVALTFDTEHPDRPCPAGVTESILATLDEAGAEFVDVSSVVQRTTAR